MKLFPERTGKNDEERMERKGEKSPPPASDVDGVMTDGRLGFDGRGGSSNFFFAGTA